MLTACGSGVAGNAAAPPPDPGARGALVEATKLLTLSEQEIAAQLQQDGFPVDHVGNGAEIHRLTYRTVDEHGRLTTATGVMALPSTSATALSVVAFQHGTMPGRDEAPSVDTGGRSDEAMLFSSAGYAAVVPDYVGLGQGPGAHPYLHAASEATAGIDLLRAARSAAAALHRSLDPKVLVTGFSQGGQAATALSKALAAGQGAPFGLRATAGVSGVYSLQHREIPALLEGRLDPVGGVFNLSYLLVAWNRIYHLYGDPAAVFRAPYDTTIAALYDGSRSEDAIFPELPGSVSELLTAEGIDLLAHPDDPLASALRENDATCAGWTSDAPVRLYASDGDEVVAASNSQHCAEQLKSSGVDVTLAPLVGAPSHFPSEIAGLDLALTWFGSDHPPAR